MNAITPITFAQTMSSREIAELVAARHDNVKRAIERLIERGIIVQPPLVDEPETDALGRTRVTKVYIFSGEQGKRDSIVAVAQLSLEFTARLVDRWSELEAKYADRGLHGVGHLRSISSGSRRLRPLGVRGI